MSAKVKVEVELTDQMLSDVMTTAVESGGYALWYWEGFQMIELWRSGADHRSGPIEDRVLDHLSVYRIEIACDHRTDGDPSTPGEYIIDLDDIAKGIEWILDGTVPVADRIRSMIINEIIEAVWAGLSGMDPLRIGDGLGIDADGADCIVQAACFKEIVFG